MERAKRFELSTFSLATRCSTTELRPHCEWNITFYLVVSRKIIQNVFYEIDFIASPIFSVM